MEYYVVGGGGGGGGGGFPASMDASEPSSALAMLQEWQLHPSADIAHQETMWRSRFPPSQEGTNIPPPTPYPERPGEQDCPYYMRTGLCRFGMSCRFNHPLNRRQASGTARSREDLPERIGQPECQYYLKTGTCKFGATCKYHHPQDKAGSMGRTQLNLLNLPLRLGERECSYYLRTGQCKFGPTCKFNHPQPTFLPLPTYLGAGSSSTPAPQPYPAWQMPRPYLLSPRLQAPPDYTPLILPPPQGVVSMHGWNPYQVQGSSIGMVPPQEGQQSNYIMGPSSPHDPMPMASPYPTYVSGSGAVFPDRPGQPECQYFMKTGDCKYGMSCKFHHPRDRPVPSPSCLLSPMGLPLRPGAQLCAFYSKHGYCKFGSQCKFDHPFIALPYSPLASPM